MSINHQQLISSHILSVIRAAEQRLGLASVLHHYQPLPQFPQLAGTQARRHKRDRQVEKLRARWIGLCRTINPALFYSGDYGLRLSR